MMVKIKKNTVLFSILLVAISIRIGLLLKLHHAYFESGVVVYHGEIARNIVDGKWFVVNMEYVEKIQKIQSADRRLVDFKDIPPPGIEEYSKPPISDTPGYGVVLAGIWKLVGQKKYIYVQIIQVILDALLIFLVYSIANFFFTRRIALITAFLFAIFFPEARLAVAANRDVWASFGAVFSLYLIAKGLKTSDRKNKILYFLFIGITVGVVSWLRPPIVFLPLFLSISLLFIKNIREFAKAFICMILPITIFFVIPFGIYNISVHNRLFTGVLGGALWEGMGEFENKYGFVCSDAAAVEFVRNEGYQGENGTPEFDNILKKRAIEIIKKDPCYYLSCVVRRIPGALFINDDLLWGIGWPQPEFKEFNYKTGNGYLDYAKTYPVQFLYRILRGFLLKGWLLFLFALVGFWISRKQWKQSLLLISPLICFVLFYIPFHVEPRYMIPGIIFYLFFTAITLDNLYVRLSKC